MAYQYYDGAQSFSSKLIEILRQTSKRHIVDRKHFAFIVVINIGVLNILHAASNQTVVTCEIKLF